MLFNFGSLTHQIQKFHAFLLLTALFSLQESIKTRFTNVDLQREVKATRIQKDLYKKGLIIYGALSCGK